MDRRVWILTIAAFVVGTVELVIAGIIEMIAHDLQISVAAAGQLVTVYSLVFAFGSPVIIALTARMERRRLLIIAMWVFFAGNILSIISPNFALLLISRVVLAASCSVIIILSITLAASIVPPALKGRAIGIIFMGLSAALMLGVPLGTWIGDRWGWRMTFVLIAVLTWIVAISVQRFLPKTPPQPSVSLRTQFGTLKNLKILSAHLISILQMTGQFTIYAYITPYLQQKMGLSTPLISLVLLIYGLAGIAGGWIGGWSADKIGPRKTILITLALHAAAILLLPYAVFHLFSLLLVVTLWCTFNMAPSPAIQSYLIETAPQSADIQLGFNTSSLHIGVALGSMIGGFIVSQYSVSDNPIAGGVIILLSIVCALYSMTRKEKHGAVERAL
ncbi:MFS transporter [Paenibacillus physcomitrellae]|uniref:Chloramphenicol resistance protein n=1 Tax=Paenibacillus physcomitrellae TaxID=1619311 RepID=A0ABQ1G3U1_9BACL|nr:MFS transporter [Paenibacillus physcomitrellae]GGA36980.1 chloramphenicol resistance protein [Paenibacillus physcomitrellae]